MSSTKEAGLTTEEAFRELYLRGYEAALDDVAQVLSLPRDAGFLQQLRGRIAGVRGKVAIDKARKALK